MEMKTGSYRYRNSHIEYTKKLFENIRKPKGRLVAVSNGGYAVGSLNPDFGYRVYWDSKAGQFNCQVLSEARARFCAEKKIREYSVSQGEKTDLDSVVTAILYNEGCIRNLLVQNGKL